MLMPGRKSDIKDEQDLSNSTGHALDWSRNERRSYEKAAAVAFGAALRRARIKAGLTQEQVAFKAGVDRTYPSLLERALRQPTLGVILALAHAVGASPSALFAAATAAFRNGDQYGD